MDKKKSQVISAFRDNPSLNVIIREKETKIDLVKYLHAACFSLVISTWLRAIENNHFTTGPGWTQQLI